MIDSLPVLYPVFCCYGHYMSVRIVLVVVFLVIPISEIYLLIEVGGIIGAIPTIFLVVFTAVFGALLIRQQGLATMLRARQQMHQGTVPAMQMLEAVALVVSGALLLTPGFLTDTIGFVLLVPVLRQFLILKMLGGTIPPSMSPSGAGPSSGKKDGGHIIEGEFKRDDD